MQKKVRVISAAVSAAMLGTASVSMASTSLLQDNFTDGNPLTINGQPQWSIFSVEGAPMTPVAGDPSTISDPIAANSGSQVQEGNGTLALTVTQNGTDFGGATSNLGPWMTTGVSSAFNFWQHPVQITIKAPPGGNLMPTALNATDHPEETANQGFLYMSLSPGVGRPDNTAAETYFRISNPYGSTSTDEGPIDTLTTQYTWRSDANNNNATPTFTTPTNTMYPRVIDPNGRITSETLFLDGSRYDPTKGSGSLNTSSLMFNWGVTFVDSKGVTHTYWVFHGSDGIPGTSGIDASRADANFGWGNYGGVGPVQQDLSTVYNAWTAVAGAGNPLNAALGIEMLRGTSGYQQPSNVTLGSISVIDPQSPGDVNYDGIVNTADFNVLAANYNGKGPTNPSDGSTNGKIWYQGDMNGDGIVNAEDFAILAANYGTNYNSPAPGAALGTLVPEPTALAGLVLAACGLVRRRRA